MSKWALPHWMWKWSKWEVFECVRGRVLHTFTGWGWMAYVLAVLHGPMVDYDDATYSGRLDDLNESDNAGDEDYWLEDGQ